MSALLNDRVLGQIVGPDGAPINLPTTLLDAAQAAALRAYFVWLMRDAKLEPELLCRSCYDGSRDSKAEFNIDEQQIVITCRCQIRFFQGASLPPDPVAASTTQRADDGGAALVQLSEDAARLLRRYKKAVLEPLGLIEVLRCNVCFDLSMMDGCEARVTTSNIRIRCRCSDRRFAGLTL